jgi:hypothetical protein
MGGGGLSTPLYPRGKYPVSILQEARWAPGPVWAGAENLALTAIRFPDRLAHSEYLYRLSYLGPHRQSNMLIKLLNLKTISIIMKVIFSLCCI